MIRFLTKLKNHGPTTSTSGTTSAANTKHSAFRATTGTAIAVFFVAFIFNSVSALHNIIPTTKDITDEQTTNSSVEETTSESTSADAANQNIDSNLENDPSVEITNNGETSATIRNTPENSKTSIMLDMTSSSSSSGDRGSTTPGDHNAPESNVLLNGEAVELSRNGRYREDFETENSDTDIRLDIDVDEDNSAGSSTVIEIRTSD